MTSSGLSVISGNFELGVDLSVNYPGIPRHPLKETFGQHHAGGAGASLSIK